MLKKFGAVCLAAVLLLTGCTLRPQENGSKVQSISRPAVESLYSRATITALP